MILCLCFLCVRMGLILCDYSLFVCKLQVFGTSRCMFMFSTKKTFYLSSKLAFLDFLIVANIPIGVFSEYISAWTVRSCEITAITICLFMYFLEFFRFFFSVKYNISKNSAALLWHHSNNNLWTIELGKAHLLNRYNYWSTFSRYVAAHFFIGIWKRNIFISILLVT